MWCVHGGRFVLSLAWGQKQNIEIIVGTKNALLLLLPLLLLRFFFNHLIKEKTLVHEEGPTPSLAERMDRNA